MYSECLTALLGVNMEFKTKGTCSNRISFEIDNGIVKNVSFNMGCDGNLQAISNLVEGLSVETVINKLKGIDCGGRGTSCPDQLARALETAERQVV